MVVRGGVNILGRWMFGVWGRMGGLWGGSRVSKGGGGGNEVRGVLVGRVGGGGYVEIMRSFEGYC